MSGRTLRQSYWGSQFQRLSLPAPTRKSNNFFTRPTLLYPLRPVRSTFSPLGSRRQPRPVTVSYSPYPALCSDVALFIKPPTPGRLQELRSRRFAGRRGRATERGVNPSTVTTASRFAQPQQAQCRSGGKGCGVGAKPLKGDAAKG